MRISAVSLSAVLGLYCLAIGTVWADDVRTVRVSEFGFDSADSTRFFEAALASGAGRIIVDRQATDWITGPISVKRSNLEIVLEDGVTVRALEGSYISVRDRVFGIYSVSNVVLRGEGTAGIIMRKADYADPTKYEKGEQRGCTVVHSSQNCVISNLFLCSSGGDGVEITNSKGVRLEDLRCDENYRQGISINSGEDVTVRRCSFTRTQGTAPMDGCDIEPFYDYHKVQNILFEDCVFEDNASTGIELYLPVVNADSPPVSIVFRRCCSRRNAGYGVHLTTAFEGAPVHGTMVFEECSFVGNASGEFLIRGQKPNGMSYSFINCTFDHRGCAKGTALNFDNSQIPSDLSDVSFEDTQLFVDGGQTPVVCQCQPGYGLTNVTGRVTLVSNGVETVFDLAAFAAANAPHPERIPVFRATPPNPADAVQPNVLVESTPWLTGTFRLMKTVTDAGPQPVVFEVERRSGTPSVHIRVTDPFGAEVAEWTVPVGRTERTFEAAADGVYQFSVDAGEAARVKITTTAWALAADQLLTFDGAGTGGALSRLSFTVPAAAEEVQAEIASSNHSIVHIFNGAGKAVFEFPESRRNQVVSVPRTPTATNEIWSIRIAYSTRMTSYRIGGDAIPLVAPKNPVAGSVTLLASDTGTTDTSFTHGDHWSDDAAPTADKSYFVPSGKTLYSPNATVTFPGGQLAVAGTLAAAQSTERVLTVPDLHLLHGASLDFTGISRFAGSVTVDATALAPARVRLGWPEAGSHNYNEMRGPLIGSATAALVVGRLPRQYSIKVPFPDRPLRFTGNLSNYKGTVTVTNQGVVSIAAALKTPATFVFADGSWGTFDQAGGGTTTVGGLALHDGATLVYTASDGQVQSLTVTDTFTNGAARLVVKGDAKLFSPESCLSLDVPLLRFTGAATNTLIDLEALTLELENFSPETAFSETYQPLPFNRTPELRVREKDGVRTLSLHIGEEKTFTRMQTGNATYDYTRSAFNPANGSYWSDGVVPELSADNDNWYFAIADLQFPSSGGSSGSFALPSARFMIAPGKVLYLQSTSLMLGELDLLPGSLIYSYSGARVKTFNGCMTVWPGDPAPFIQVYGGYELDIFGELRGTGDFTLRSYQYWSDYSSGTVGFYSVATNFHGKFYVTALQNNRTENKFYRVRLRDGRSLGGSYTGSTPLRSIEFKNAQVSIEGDVVVDEPSRGVMFSGTTLVDVAEGCRFKLQVPTTFNGTYAKTGPGTLELAGQPLFGSASTTTSLSTVNGLTIEEGALRIGAARAAAGLSLKFLPGAVLELAADAEDDDLRTRGLVNGIAASFKLDGGSIPVRLTADRPLGESRRFVRRAICTLSDQARVTDDDFAVSLSGTGLEGYEPRGVTHQSNGDGTSTYFATFEHVTAGFSVIVK